MASLFLLPACVNPQPMTASTSFVSAEQPAAHQVPVPCRLRILSIHDDRLDPTVLGEVAGRAVLTPNDVEGWLHSVLTGMKSSGVNVVFAADVPTESGDIDARVGLLKAWVASEATAKTAGVAMQFTFLRDGTILRERAYRGGVSTPNWDSGTGEIQRMINTAFGQVLRQTATDVRMLCGEPDQRKRHSQAPGSGRQAAGSST